MYIILTFYSNKMQHNIYNKELSYRRETARQHCDTYDSGIVLELGNYARKVGPYILFKSTECCHITACFNSQH